jgi:DNA-binding LacI/PurR family transcriptional regulator
MNLPNQGESSAWGDDAGGETKVPRKLADLQKTITMAQIARAAGVSQGAISSLLNDRDYGIRVSEKTRERVFKVCREMGYIPNDLRAVVRMYPELGDFCLLLSTRRAAGVADPFLSRLAAATMEALPASSRGLTVGCYEEKIDYSDPERLPHPVRSGVASKFVIWGGPNSTLIHALLRRGWPLISLGYDVPIAGVLTLIPDYKTASRLALEHLFKLGHRNIAIVSGPFGSTDAQIIELNRGVRLAFEQLGVPMDAQNIIYGDLTQQAGAAAFDALIERKPEPTAVFCMTDTAAAGVILQAYARGRSVPEHLSVIGCSDDLLAQFTCPALTTIHLPAEEMAAQGVKEIDRMVREGPSEKARRTVLPVHLVERKSCGPVNARTSAGTRNIAP